MLRILKNKSGMTLVELLTGILLFTIIAATVSAILVPMLKVYASANEIAECNTLLDNVANRIVKDLSSATVPLEDDNDLSIGNTISVTVDSPKDVTYTVDSDGVLCYVNSENTEIPILSKNYYKNKSVNFTCEAAGSGPVTAYTLTVSIIDRYGEPMISREYAVKPLALNQYK